MKIFTEENKPSWKIITAFIAGMIFCVLLYEATMWFHDNYRFQPLIVPRYMSPVIEEPIVAIPITPTAPKPNKEASRSSEYELAYNKVHLMESTSGTNKTGLNGYCINNGGVNEIGYAPHLKYCFTDTQEQKDTFMLWLDNRLNKIKQPYCNSIDECLLTYSNGAYGLE